MSKTTTEKPKTDIAPVGDFSSDANMGFERATQEAYAIPFLSILQSGSPQCKKSEGAYIKGAEEGMLYNSVTGQIYDGDAGIEVVPCSFSQSFVEWATRESGGGYRGEHPVDTPLRHQTQKDDKGRDILPNGNQLNDTRVHYVMVLDEKGIPTPAVISMTSTQIKKSKVWMAAMQNRKEMGANGPYTPPMCAQVWKITTKAESNDKGSWFGFHFEPTRMLSGPSDPIYLMAKSFGQSILKGAARADHSRAEGAEGGIGDEIPF